MQNALVGRHSTRRERYIKKIIDADTFPEGEQKQAQVSLFHIEGGEVEDLLKLPCEHLARLKKIRKKF